MYTYKVTYAISEVRVAFIDVDRNETPEEVFERMYNEYDGNIPTYEFVEVDSELRHVEPAKIEVSVEGQVSRLYHYRTTVTVSAKALAESLEGNHDELLFENSELIASVVTEDDFDCADVKVTDVEIP